MYSVEDLKNTEQEIARLQQKRRDIIYDIKKNNDKPIEQIVDMPDFLKEFKCVDSLRVDENTVVVYQGVPGAYSHQAMYDFFGKDIKNINVGKFEDVITAVKDGKADYGVLPIENSSAGFVNGIYDMVGRSGITIVGENEVHVAHVLMGVDGAKQSDIKKVYSHNQGLLQCKDFLDREGFETVSVANTAMAAMQVKEEGDKSKAAIASLLAADIYGLSVLNRNIVNNANNTTKFVILSRHKIFVRGVKNISICFSLPHESGTLYNILSNINLSGINMTSIESRPLPGKKWEYSFFITMEASLTDPGTIKALAGMKRDSGDFKLIGTF